MAGTGAGVFGVWLRIHPVLAELRSHQGIDIADPMKSPVLAVAPGKVVVVHEQDTGYGLSVEIEYVPSVCTRYAHMDTVVVHLHDKLDQNSVIGTVGNTGLSTGPHLHSEVLLLGKAIVIHSLFLKIGMLLFRMGCSGRQYSTCMKNGLMRLRILRKPFICSLVVNFSF